MAKKKEGRDFLSIGTWVKFDTRVAKMVDRETFSKRQFEEWPCGEDALEARNPAFIPGERPAPVAHYGQIVGGKFLRRGHTVDLGYDAGLAFESEGPSLFVYLVRVGFINRPIWVPVENVVVSEEEHTMPYMYQHWPDHYKKLVSRDMKQMDKEGLLPRDEKGRFVPVG